MRNIFRRNRCLLSVPVWAGAITLFFPAGCSFHAAQKRLYPDRAETVRVFRLSELSGMAVSGVFPGLLWGINDSGNTPELFAMDSRGNPVYPFVIRADSAANRDWEDMASDGKGRLFIADTGNNRNRRRDLGILVVDENEIDTESKTVPSKFIALEFPGQQEFPPPRKERNYDCEALCYFRGTLCLFTKNRGNKMTDLYILEEADAFSGPPAYKESFPVEGLVTGADVHPAGFLALLTYREILIFDVSGKITLQNPVKRFSLDTLQAKQCESILFTPEGIVISNEQRDLYLFTYAQLGLSF